MSNVYRWFRSGSQATCERAKTLMDKAYNPPPGGALTYVREDYHQFPGVLWGVPVGAGSGANSNPGAMAIENTRASVLDGTNTHLTDEERAELVGYLGQDEELANDWWYDEAGEAAREPPQEE